VLRPGDNLVEEPFDQIARPVEIPAEAIGVLAVTHWRDIGQGTLLVDERHAPRLGREQWLYDSPFIDPEFTTHDSWLRFGSLNHVSGNITNGKPHCLQWLPEEQFATSQTVN
jgi:hypothetical protein